MRIALFLVMAAMLGLSWNANAATAMEKSHRHSTTHIRHTRPVVVYVLPGYRPGFTGGWYALNYHYYWGRQPLVNSEDPYDYNGNYFPPSRR